jgi:virulence-associated protein VagC
MQANLQTNSRTPWYNEFRAIGCGEVLIRVMKTVEIIETNNGQAIPLPEEFRLETHTVSIRREGDALILEPVKQSQWPKHFFEDIRIDDPAFDRPDQGSTPPVQSLE